MTGTAGAWWKRVAEFVGAVIGAPSYEVYLEHMASAHPNMTPLDREDFVCSRLHARYSKPGARCC
ncbi:MAG: YbdD/YjiX family protein [Gemmatimonadaceae bacterium]